MKKIILASLVVCNCTFFIFCGFHLFGSTAMATDTESTFAASRVASSNSLASSSDIIHSKLPLSIKDTGIFSNLNKSVHLSLSPPLDATVSLSVNKKKRTLSVLYNNVPVKTYPIALGFSPLGDKNIEGDGKTPEGFYFIADKRHKKLPAKYGPRSMLISYPGTKDAKRGLKKGQISKKVAGTIEHSIAIGDIPPQNTPLGSSIRIHGGGVHDDWTAGCIALRDDDAKEIYSVVKVGTLVHISSSSSPNIDKDADGIPNQVDVIAGAVKTDLNDASYDGSYQTIAYPNGDVSRKKGVCTDVVIRAFRNAGIDLQLEMHKDILAHPSAYAHISKPSTNIDHRRVKNMVIYMKRHFASLPIDSDFLPGDIALFDTLPKKGADHIGIVSDTMGPNKFLMVINNWTDGAVTDKMDLLSWLPITHHFRLK